MAPMPLLQLGVPLHDRVGTDLLTAPTIRMTATTTTTPIMIYVVVLSCLGAGDGAGDGAVVGAGDAAGVGVADGAGLADSATGVPLPADAIAENAGLRARSADRTPTAIVGVRMTRPPSLTIKPIPLVQPRLRGRIAWVKQISNRAFGKACYAYFERMGIGALPIRGGYRPSSYS